MPPPPAESNFLSVCIARIGDWGESTGGLVGERIRLISVLTIVLLSLSGGCDSWWQGSPAEVPNDPTSPPDVPPDVPPNVTLPPGLDMPCDPNEYVIQRPVSLVVFMKQGQRELFRSAIEIDPQDLLAADAQTARYYMVADPNGM